MSSIYQDRFRRVQSMYPDADRDDTGSMSRG